MPFTALLSHPLPHEVQQALSALINRLEPPSTSTKKDQASLENLVNVLAEVRQALLDAEVQVPPVDVAVPERACQAEAASLWVAP
jgi:hypothetical protein